MEVGGSFWGARVRVASGRFFSSRKFPESQLCKGETGTLPHSTATPPKAPHFGHWAERQANGQGKQKVRLQACLTAFTLAKRMHWAYLFGDFAALSAVSRFSFFVFSFAIPKAA